MKKLPATTHRGKAEPSLYRDRVPIVIVSLVMGGILCAYGYRGGIMEAATYPEFILIGWMYGLACYGVLYFISKMTVRLDLNCGWQISFYQRVVMQLFYCWIVPTGMVFIVFLVFSVVLPLQLRESTFLYIDIYIAALLLLLVNAYYVIAFYISYTSVLHARLVSEKNVWEEEKAKRDAAYAKISADQNKQIQALKEEIRVEKGKYEAFQSATEKELPDLAGRKEAIYLLKLGATTMRIPHRDIALFFMRNGLPWIRLMNGEEYYATEKTLNEVYKTVASCFFVVRRSFLINDKAIGRCVRRENKRLVLILNDKDKTEVLGPVEPDEKLEKRILEVVDILAEREDINNKKM